MPGMQPVPGMQMIIGAMTMVRGLPDGNYTVEWWDTWQGTNIAQQPAQCMNGGLPLQFPPIVTDIAARIGLLESREEIWAKLRPAVTDPKRIKRTDPGTPEVCNIYHLHKAFSPPETVEHVAVQCSTAGWGCIDCKKVLAESIETGSTYRVAEEAVGYHPLEFSVYGRSGVACRTCGKALESVRLGNRSTIFCPRCQR